MIDNFGNLEIIQIAEAVSKEKDISRDTIISIMERSIEAAYKKKYGNEHNIVVEINKKSGEIQAYRALEITETPLNIVTQISLSDAILKNPDAIIGEYITEPLPPVYFDRTSAQSAKRIIIQDIKNLEMEKQYESFKNRKGEIISGVIKKIEFGNIIVELGRTEGILRKQDSIRMESFRPGERIKAYVKDVVRDNKLPQILLSRACDDMLKKLFALEVPEIYEGVIEIVEVARDPGSKSKIAVISKDPSIDPIGSCIGIKGARIKNIMNELSGEKIDIVQWHKDPAQFIINALAPAEISRVTLEHDKKRVDVILNNDQFSIAIGRKGQNIRLASKLTRWNIDIMTEDEASKKRFAEFNNSVAVFIEGLDVDEIIAQLLTAAGFTSINQVAAASVEFLSKIEGFDHILAQELKSRAEIYVENINDHIIQQLESLGVEQELLDRLSDLDPEYILKLAEYGIKSIEDLDELSMQEFNQIVKKHNLSELEIKTLLNK